MKQYNRGLGHELTRIAKERDRLQAALVVRMMEELKVKNRKGVVALLEVWRKVYVRV